MKSNRLSHCGFYLVMGVGMLVLTWLFVGIYRDDEFSSFHLFFKYRPTAKVYFYSPVGMGDESIADLSPVFKQAQFDFKAFVIDRGIAGNSFPNFWYVPFLLIQLTLTFFSFGIWILRYSVRFRKWLFFLHFFGCLIISTLLHSLMLLYLEHLILALGLLSLLFVFNYMALFWLGKTPAVGFIHDLNK